MYTKNLFVCLMISVLIMAELDLAQAESCACNRMFRPVCGTDDETYSNECLLNCRMKEVNGLRIKHAGLCENVKESDSSI
ncbi:ovomucoid-like [Lycorma delicatula]|uniref:ovomucoid-like n=1 Tax=Lycorma delicatula TaxID=130591 RepID=UPI003F50DF4E